LKLAELMKSIGAKRGRTAGETAIAWALSWLRKLEKTAAARATPCS